MPRGGFLLVLAVAGVHLPGEALALVPASRPPLTSGGRRPSATTPKPERHGVARCQEGSYDLGRKSFDLLEWKEFRHETLLQYDLLNRVEVLRIILFALTAVASALTPAIAKELALVDPSGDQGYLTAAAGTLFFGGLAARSKVSRGGKLRRLENEFAASELGICQPRSVFGNGQRRWTLSELRGNRRVIALYGPPEVLRGALAAAEVYRTRWPQSAVMVVAVASAGEEVRGRRETSRAATTVSGASS